MAPNVSKNAKTNRSAKEETVFNYNGTDVAVTPALFIGKTDGKRNYMALQAKKNRALLLDRDGMPISWKTATLVKRKIS